jgi:signal transduction histidine kinase
MGAVRRHVHKLAYVLITVALVLTFGAGTVSGFRLHHTASVERQTIRTQSLETEVLEHDLAGVRAAFANLGKNDANEAARLQSGYVAYLRAPSTSRTFEQDIEAELTRQSHAFHQSVTAARQAVVTLVVLAFLLVLTFLWLFELERRAGRIDRDNATRNAELIRLRDEFVAVVSHELRTPLTSIIGYLELLVEDDAGTLTREQQSYVEIVQRSTNRLVELVGELLLVAESERGPLALELREIDFGSLAENAVQAARPTADAREIVLTLYQRTPGSIVGDPTRLAQMLDNLVSNAIKFTPDGGGVTVRTARQFNDILFEVADTGGGIAEIDRERLFDPFFRSREATARAVPGTGLGLTITKAIVDAHHGTIAVANTPGGGATFRVLLPVAARVATPAVAELG